MRRVEGDLGILNLLFKFYTDLFWSRLCDSIYMSLSKRERERQRSMENKTDSEIDGCYIVEGFCFAPCPFICLILSLPFHKKSFTSVLGSKTTIGVLAFRKIFLFLLLFLFCPFFIKEKNRFLIVIWPSMVSYLLCALSFLSCLTHTNS